MLMTILGWEPRVKLADGLKNTIGYFDGLLSDGLIAGDATTRDGDSHRISAWEPLRATDVSH